MGVFGVKGAAAVLVGAMAIGGAMVGAASAQSRDVQDVSIVYDVANNVVIEEGSSISSPDQIAIETFVRLNLRLILDEQSANRLLKSYDGSTASPEEAGCTPNDYGPMAMERDLFYFIETPPVDGRSVRATIYPGDRSEHWANDVFCEYDSDYGDAYAVATMSGFFYVIPRQRKDAVDVMLRAITPTESEVQRLQRR